MNPTPIGLVVQVIPSICLVEEVEAVEEVEVVEVVEVEVAGETLTTEAL